MLLAVSHPAEGVTKHAIQGRDGREMIAACVQGGNTSADIRLINYMVVLVCETLDKELQLFPSPF